MCRSMVFFTFLCTLRFLRLSCMQSNQLNKTNLFKYVALINLIVYYWMVINQSHYRLTSQQICVLHDLIYSKIKSQLYRGHFRPDRSLLNKYLTCACWGQTEGHHQLLHGRTRDWFPALVNQSLRCLTQVPPPSRTSLCPLVDIKSNVLPESMWREGTRIHKVLFG